VEATRGGIGGWWGDGVVWDHQVREFWTRLDNVTSPKDLAKIAARLLGSPTCIPEAWWVLSLGFRVSGSGFRVSGLGFREPHVHPGGVVGLGFRV